MLSFTTDTITVNETRGLGNVFYLQISRTGSLDNKTVVPSALVLDSQKYLFKNSSNDRCQYQSIILHNNFSFPANTSDASTVGIILDDLVYDEPRALRYCLITPENESDFNYKFVHQCINITVYDYEDCKQNI